MKKLLGSVLFTALVGMTAACGPEDVGNNLGGTCEPVAATDTCEGGIDEDCDGLIDCNDSDCAGYPSCPPPCGTVSAEDLNLPLPDGVLLPDVYPDGDYEVSEVVPYLGKSNLSGFASGAKLQNGSDLLSICMNMEHSWARDLQIELICPSGQSLLLHKYDGIENGTEIFLGEPDDSDAAATPNPGVGYDYCWTPTATNPSILTYANQNTDDDFVDETLPYKLTVPAGDYKPDGSFSDLEGCTLEGEWTVKVSDVWLLDNGYIFSWKINFNPALVQDCSVW